MARTLPCDSTRMLIVILALTAVGTIAQDQPATDTAKSETTWRFAVSGDSRNCGDVVMPAIAADAQKQNAAFYWHLGDFRWIYLIDEDMVCGPNHLDGLSGHIKYLETVWDDFRENQIAGFGSMPVFLGIGNHEMIAHHDREDFLLKFDKWLDSPVLRAQRFKDDPEDRNPHSYYHWIDRGIDFINLDNASKDEFSADQMKWFSKVVARDLADASVKTLVVGMHEALPDSISFSHSMSKSKNGIKTGRSVYNTLLNAQNNAHKHVYVLASHSHFYAENIYDTDYWRPKGVLPGWIVGTAGAARYCLPAGVQAGPHARTDVYGYLLATAHFGGASDGTIDFAFTEIHADQVPEGIRSRFDHGFVDWCFSANHDPQCKRDQEPACGKQNAARVDH